MPVPLLAKYRDRRRNDSTADIVDAQKIGTDLNWAEDLLCIAVPIGVVKLLRFSMPSIGSNRKPPAFRRRCA